MIDNPKQVERLLAKLKESLPLFAVLTPEVAAIVREQSPAVELSQRYAITRIEYAGDEGGIVCKVDLGPTNDDRALFASITHLRFNQAEQSPVRSPRTRNTARNACRADTAAVQQYGGKSS